jgi:4a-hydroxytetrahydrobiopterin dehydratase
MRLLTPDEIDRQLPPGWAGNPGALRCAYTLPTFRTAIDVVGAVADDAEEMDHHPDIDVRFRALHFTLSTHSAGGVTQLDIELAHRIADICARLGGTVTPSA